MIEEQDTAQPSQPEPEPPIFDRADIEMFFRCLMQFARHLAKKYGFTIKQWPEN